MDIFVYAKKDDRNGSQLKNVIESSSLEEKIQVYHYIELFAIMLRKTLCKETVAVLLASNREELLKIVSIGDLLDEIPIILIIPDQHEDTIHKAHALRPRFLAYTDSDFKDVAAVLKKMLENKHSR